MENPQPTAAFIIIGDEILSGRTVDKNMNFIALELTRIGIPLKEVRVVADIEEEIISTINALRKKYTYLFTSGGIGPTHDDITAESVAKAFDVPLECNKEALRRLEEYYINKNDGQKINDARRKMAFMPTNVTLIDNSVSAAPGFIKENVHVMAGIPNIFQSMLLSVTPNLSGGKVTHAHEQTYYIGEGDIAHILKKEQKEHVGLMTIGSYPFVEPNGRIGTNVVIRSTDQALIKQVNERIDQQATPLIQAQESNN